MTRYNIVDEGADNTGTNPVDDVLNSLIGSDDTVYFPPGDYRLNSLDVPSSVQNFRIKGAEIGTSTLIPRDWGTQSPSAWIDVDGDGFVMDAFGIAVNTRAPGQITITASDWEMTRVATHGEVYAERDGETPGNSGVAQNWLRPIVTDPGAHGLIEDCYFHDGSNQSVEAGSNRRAILVERGDGDLYINRCWFEQWGENTIYAKKPAGAVNILNSFWKNTQNGVRTGGNTLVRNCVAIKDGPMPLNWQSSALQRGVAYEATDDNPLTSDMDVYNGMHTVQDCDILVDYVPASGPESAGAAIGGSSAPERAEIIDTRIYYRTNRSHDAIYNNNKNSEFGPIRYWAFDGVHITNDATAGQYAIDVGATPDTWGPVNGVLGGTNTNWSTSSYITDNMTTNGTPDQPDTTPPLPSPPASDTAPMTSPELITIDNSADDTESNYSFSSTGNIWPTLRGAATDINMEWEAPGIPSRGTTDAIGTVPGGEIQSYYIEGSLTAGSFAQDGSADVTTTTIGESIGPVARLPRDGEWKRIPDASVTLNGIPVPVYLPRNGEWMTVIDDT